MTTISSVNCNNPVDPSTPTVNSVHQFDFPYMDEPYFFNRYVQLFYDERIALREYLNQLAGLYASAGQLNSKRHQFEERNLIQRYFVRVGI